MSLFYATSSESDEQALRQVLYGLSAIIKLHLAKEEEIYSAPPGGPITGFGSGARGRSGGGTVNEAKSSL